MPSLAKILNIEKSEQKAVVYLIIYSFFIGAALAYYVTSSTSLFLSVFDRDFLSISFIAAGIIVWITGAGMNFLFKKMNFSKSLPLGLFFLLITILIFLVFYKIWQGLAIVFLLYAWIRIFSYIHAVVFWSMAGRLFSLQQGKRLFSLITGGEVLASIMSFFSVPVLLKFIETADILIISGIFLVFAFVFMFFIVRKFNDKLSIKKAENDVVKNTEVKLFSSKYFRLIFWIAFIPIFAQFFVDFIFQTQSKVEFPDREELTAFIGVFMGFGAIVEFSLKTFISGRLLSKYGMLLGLLAFPLVLGLSFFLASVFGVIFGVIGLFFSFVSMGRLFTRAVRTSFQDTANQILYQPIPVEQRIILQNKIESGPKAYASIVAGIFLLALNQIPNLSLTVFSILLFVVTVVWTIISLEVHKEYKQQVQEYLSKSTTFVIKTNIKLLLKYFKQVFSMGYNFLSYKILKLFLPFESTFEINVHSPNQYKISEIAEKASSSNYHDRIIAAACLVDFNIYKTEKLFDRLLSDENFEVRNQALVSAGIVKEKELFEKIIDNFKTEIYRKSASNAILNIGEAIIPKLISTFHSSEYNTDLQIEIVKIITHLQSKHSTDFLRGLMNYHIKSVRQLALASLSEINYHSNKLEKPYISAFLEEELKYFVYLTASLLDLKELDDEDFLVMELKKNIEEKRNYIFDILAILYSKNVVDLIRNNLVNNDSDSRGFAIEIADNILTDIHKELLLPIFEDLGKVEIVRRYKHIYPQEDLELYERYIDLINADLSVTGIFVKTEAIKKLLDFKNEKSISILNAQLVSPVEIISETAAYVLFILDAEEFEKSINSLMTVKNNLLNVYNYLKQIGEKSSLLTFEKFQLLKGFELFKILSNEDIYYISKNSQQFVVTENQKYDLLKYNSNDVHILLYGRLKTPNGNEYDSGSIISNFYVNYENNQSFECVENSMIFKIPLFVFNTLFNNNFDFAKNVFHEIIKQEKPK